MRHNYAGDEGDYTKLALLRALTRGRRLGVNWYLTVHPEGEGQAGAGDGNLRKHLREDGWDHLDPELLDRMRSVFGQLDPTQRHVGLLEDEVLLPGATFFQEALATPETPLSERVEARLAWHERALHKLEEADVVFLDPDNGFQVKSQGPRSQRFSKYATYAEVADYLARGKAVVAYQHRPGTFQLGLLRKIVQDHWRDEEGKAVRRLFLNDVHPVPKPRSPGGSVRAGQLTAWRHRQRILPMWNKAIVAIRPPNPRGNRNNVHFSELPNSGCSQNQGASLHCELHPSFGDTYR